MVQIISWQPEQAKATIARAVELLRAGQLVAFPTDTVYKIAASVAAPAAVERLRSVGNRPVLGIATEAQAGRWGDLGVLGQRLARRCWPGPVTLACPASRAAAVPDMIRTAVTADGLVQLRVPDHDSILEALFQLDQPLLLADAGIPATSASQVVERAGDAVDLVIDDGPSEQDRDATVVQVEGKSWRVLSEGVVSTADLARFTPCHIVFVCTGNTCRSPLAEALCRKLLADRLGCQAQELPQRGFVVHSAGLSAMMGRGASAEAMEVAQQYSADLSAHCSKPLTLEMLRQADHLFLMTQGHLLALENLPQGVGPRPRLLSPTGCDVVDPFGGAIEDYRECAEQIHRALQQLLPELSE